MIIIIFYTQIKSVRFLKFYSHVLSAIYIQIKALRILLRLKLFSSVSIIITAG